MKSRKRYFRYTFIPTLIGLLIFYGTCLVNVSDIPKIESKVPLDKIVHFGMFLMLAGTNSYNYYKIHQENPRVMRWIFFGLIFPIVYGGVIEVLQRHYFARDAEWGDFIADALGALCGMFLVIYYLKRKKAAKKRYLCD